MSFRRKLSPHLLSRLQEGLGRRIFEASVAVGLDARIRPGALSLYMQGRSIAKLTGRRGHPLVLTVHHKYLDADRIGGHLGSRSGDYRKFAIDPSFVEDYVQHLPEICDRARDHVGAEEDVELRLIEANGANRAVCCFDRQVQVPGAKGRLDVLGWMAAPEPALVAIEVKRFPDRSIQRVPAQVRGYVDILGPEGRGLRTDIADAYRTLCAQLHALGLPAPEPAGIEGGMPVLGLVIVADYADKSDLLPRAHRLAASLEGDVFLWCADAQDYRIPPRSSWMHMGAS